MKRFYEILDETSVLSDYENFSSLGTSCAIVGNSGNVMKHEYGELINSHDVVIRCGDAPTEGYEKHVGTKTSCRIANSHMFDAALENTALDLERMNRIFSKFDKNALYNIENQIIIVKNGVNANACREVIKRVEEKNNTVIFMNPVFYNLCNQLVGAHSTSGMAAIIMALKYFPKISCFGFSFYEEDWSTIHYYEEVTPYDQGCHKFDVEKEIVAEFSRAGKIDMYPAID